LLDVSCLEYGQGSNPAKQLLNIRIRSQHNKLHKHHLHITVLIQILSCISKFHDSNCKTIQPVNQHHSATTPWAIKNVPLYFGLLLPCFLMDFNTLCTNGKRNKYSTLRFTF